MGIFNFRNLSTCAVAAVLCAACLPALAATRADVVDAVASGAKLTKADAGRVVDATLQAIANGLSSDAGTAPSRVALSELGTFYVTSSIASDNDTCTGIPDVGFDPADSFVALINPIAMDKGLRFRVASVTSSPGGVEVTGTVEVGSVAAGDLVSFKSSPLDPTIEVANVYVDGVAVTEATGGQVATLALRGIEKKDIKRGMVIIKPRRTPAPGPVLSPCFDYLLDQDIAAEAASAARVNPETALLVLDILKAFSKDTVAGGHAVDLGGFGIFYVLGEQVLSEVDAGTDLATNKKKKVKFKAGVELAHSVN
jgi:nucleoid DNA-binding protein